MCADSGTDTESPTKTITVQLNQHAHNL